MLFVFFDIIQRYLARSKAHVVRPCWNLDDLECAYQYLSVANVTNLLYNTKCINQNILNLINIKNLDIIDIKNKGIAAENELFMNKNIYIEYGFYSHKFTITITYPSFDKL